MVQPPGCDHRTSVPQFSDIENRVYPLVCVAAQDELQPQSRQDRCLKLFVGVVISCNCFASAAFFNALLRVVGTGQSSEIGKYHKLEQLAKKKKEKKMGSGECGFKMASMCAVVS